jgi:hypothetical protein
VGAAVVAAGAVVAASVGVSADGLVVGEAPAEAQPAAMPAITTRVARIRFIEGLQYTAADVRSAADPICSGPYAAVPMTVSAVRGCEN